MKAAIYARISTDEQSVASIDDQIRVCREFAVKRGLHIAGEYVDAHISGSAFGNRPQFLRMRADAEARNLDAIIVAHTDRLSRSSDLEPLVRRLRFHGIRVLGVHNDFDSENEVSDLQASVDGIVSTQFIKMVRARTHSALTMRAKDGRPTGGKAYGYRGTEVDRGEAFIVREIFGRFADGESCRTIAADLNRRNIQSPGSSWARKERRCAGWAGSGIRAIVLNPRYAGRITWNTSKWVKDPDSGRRLRRERPRSEWIERQDESLRIVSDELFERAQRRFRPSAQDHTVRCGGKPKYLLSGLLRCSKCNAHYTIMNASLYGCSGQVDGDSCDNAVRISRKRCEDVLIGQIREQVLAPESVAQIAKDMQAIVLERARSQVAAAVERPRELQEIEARIARLRARLKAGDPDMAPDELQAAIALAERKREELLRQEPETKRANRVIAMLPRAARSNSRSPATRAQRQKLG